MTQPNTHPVAAPMNLLGRTKDEVLCVPTGEVRPPQVGEWYLTDQGEADLSGYNMSTARPIVRLVEAEEMR